MGFFGMAFWSWLILTILRALIFYIWLLIVGRNWPRGYWVLLAPQIVLIFAYSYGLLKTFPLKSSQDWLFIGIYWLALTLAFEFIGVLGFEKGNLALLFEGWKIWKGNIWVLVLLSYFLAPFLLSQLIGRFWSDNILKLCLEWNWYELVNIPNLRGYYQEQQYWANVSDE